MLSVSTLAYWGGLILIGGFFGIVSWKAVTGSIDLGQLLDGDIRDRISPEGYSSYASSGRAQLLLITTFTALFYLLQVLRNPGVFPSLPDGLVGAVAVSQALYLGGKARAMLLGRWRDFLK